MFFALSKILWFVANPGNLLLIGLVVGVALLAGRRERAGRGVLAAVAALAVFIAVVPVGRWMIGALEDRFRAVAEPPARVDGIVVAGGVVDPGLSAARHRAAINDHVERLFALAALAKRYPEARLIFSGGSGSLLHPEKREARVIAPVLRALGVDPARVTFEDQSRNTAENAAFSYRLARPKSGETWLLITSAFHMPRAVGCFRRVGWRVVPYPVDYATSGKSEMPLQFDLTGGLAALNAGIHEFLGLFFYWASGRTDALFPGPA